MSAHTPLFLCFFLITISHLHFSIFAEYDNYIIHMDTSAMPKAFSTQHAWYMASLSSALNISPTLESSLSSKLIYSYANVINGFSASLSPSELEALKTIPGYISAIRDLPAKPDTTYSPQFLNLKPSFGVWPMADYGNDIIIGVVDTGIWPESQSFKDDGLSEIPPRWKGKCETGTQFNSSLCNKKLIGARYFNKGLLAKHRNITIVMNSTRDTEGHGTHTSSTAAGGYVDGASYFGYAAGKASGVAPKARVAMYKALWEEGTYTSDIIAAIDSAISDGVDVISLSLGLDGVPLYEDPIAMATFAAVEKGIFVSTSAGNEGPFLETLHNGTPWVITVASGTMDRLFQGTLNLGNGNSVTGLSLYPGNFTASQIPIVYMGLCGNQKDLKKVRNKIVVCEDKNQTLIDQVSNLDTAKVVAGVFLSNSPDVTSFLQTGFPSIFVDPKDGETIKSYIKSSDSLPKASMVFGMTIISSSKGAPSVDSYSSRGPSQSCPVVLKPDVMAPGTLILAAWPENVPAAVLGTQNLFSNFNLLSGTSMACPHVAGLAALLKGVHRDWSPAAIRSAIMTTAEAFDKTITPIKDIGDNYKMATPLAIGAGHINPNRALDPGLVYDAETQDYVNLLCGLNFSEKNISIITRSSKNNCSNKSLDLNYPSFIAFFNANDSASATKTRTVKEFHRTVTNVGEGPSSYFVIPIFEMEGFEVSVVPSLLVFKEKKEKQSYKLRIKGPRMMKETVASGWLLWTDSQHIVRSPIVVTNLDSNAISSLS